MTKERSALERCLHCDTPTRQRAEGKPYCSMDCIGARRRELKKETIECPYPGCRWETQYHPGNGLQKAVAYKKAEDHRVLHRENGDFLKSGKVGPGNDGTVGGDDGE